MAALRRRFLQDMAEDNLSSQWTDQGFAIFAWSFARLGVRDAAMMKAIGRVLLQPNGLGRFSGQSLAVLASAYAMMLLRHESLFLAIARTICENTDIVLDSQAIVTIAWAFARVQVRDIDLMVRLARQAAPHAELLSSFSPVGIARMVWAFAKLYVPLPSFLHAVAHWMQQVGAVAELEPHTITMILCAFASMQFSAREVLGHVAEELVEAGAVAHFGAYALTSFAWAYASLSYEHRPLMRGIGLRLVDPEVLAAATPEALARVMWAFARLQLRHLPGMMVVAAHVLQAGALADFKPKELSNFFFAFVQLRLSTPALYEAIARRLADEGFVRTFNLQDLTVCAWSLACAGVVADEPFTTLLLAVSVNVRAHPPHGVSLKHLSRLHMVHLHIAENAARLPHSTTTMLADPNLVAQCKALFITHGAAKAEYTAHVSMVKALQAAGFAVTEKELLQNGAAHMANVLVHHPQGWVVVEVEPQSSFLHDIAEEESRGTSVQLCGEVKFRHRQILAAGYRILSIPHFQWMSLSPADQLAYLWSALGRPC
eukprot:GGOE01062009.1.p1 GENE.GGOE01062009.1~~GGOE01062009.1.p1  ORF type:complete len:560 (+),score=155.75 GGOE01062009.1:54-1682(+)